MEDFTAISGELFNKLYQNVVFVKLTNESENHNGLQFKDGLIIDPIPFNPKGKCEPGGIYFIKWSGAEVKRWIDYGNGVMIYYRNVELPNDAQVYYSAEGKFKADKMILGPRKEIFKNEAWCRSILKRDGKLIKYIKPQTEELCRIAVQQCGSALGEIEDQTEDLCIMALNRNGTALRFVRKQTEELCKLAVQENGLALKHVQNRTEEICKLAVQRNGNALLYVDEQTEEICELAVQQTGFALQHVHNQTEKVCELAVQEDALALQYVDCKRMAERLTKISFSRKWKKQSKEFFTVEDQEESN